jgi:hypothetical protein
MGTFISPVNTKLIDTNGTPQGVLFEDGTITVRQYLQALSEGDVAGHSSFNKFGITTLGTGGGEIWGGAAAYVFPVAAAGMRVVSSSANDAAAGTGIRTIRIYYLDAGYVEKTTDVILNGTTPVNTTVTDIFRINRVRALTVGSGAVAAGIINVYNLVAATVYAVIQTGNTISRDLIYTVPIGKTIYITSATFGITKASTTGNAATFTLRANYDDMLKTVLPIGFFMPYSEVNQLDGAFERSFELPLYFGQTVDIKMSCIPAQAATVCSCAIRGWIE